MSAAPVTADPQGSTGPWRPAVGVVEDRLVDGGVAQEAHRNLLLGDPREAGDRRRAPLRGASSRRRRTDARIPAFNPNMWKYGLTMR